MKQPPGVIFQDGLLVGGAESGLLDLKGRGLKIEKWKVRAEHHTLRGYFRRHRSYAADAFHHGDIEIDIARCSDFLAQWIARRIQDHQPQGWHAGHDFSQWRQIDARD